MLSTKLATAVLAAFLLATSVATAEECDTDVVARRKSAAQLQRTNEQRQRLAGEEFEARLALYSGGRESVNVAIQSSLRLLHATISVDPTDAGSAAIAYDKRAAAIEAVAAERANQRGAAKYGRHRASDPQEDLKQARQARLNALLKEMVDAKR